MPALMKTGIQGEIVWLGLVPDRATSLMSTPVAEVVARFSGPQGEAHGGLTRPHAVACCRNIRAAPKFEIHGNSLCFVLRNSTLLPGKWGWRRWTQHFWARRW